MFELEWRIIPNFIIVVPLFYGSKNTGELAEWLNVAVLKTVKDVSPSGVRIPDSPQKQENLARNRKILGFFLNFC